MAFNRFNRSEYYRKEIVDGKEEFDFTSCSINDFKFNREKSFYKITQRDLLRPDLIAINAYEDRNAQTYWWIILTLNNIHDIWNDLSEGQILSIPNRKDVEEFVIANRNIRNDD